MSRGARRPLVVAVVVIAVAVAVGGAAVAYVATRGGGAGPDVTARSFAAGWSRGDTNALKALAVNPNSLDAFDPSKVASKLGATTSIAVTKVDQKGGKATASFTATLSLKGAGDVQWDGALPLTKVKAGWRVDWSESAMHPAMPGGGTITASTTWPTRAPILGVNGVQLVGGVDTVRIGVVPGQFDPAGAPVLAQALGLDPNAITSALAAPSAKAGQFVSVGVVPAAKYQAAKPVVYPIKGVQFRPERGRSGPFPGFAQQVLGRFGDITADRLAQLGPPYQAGDQVGLDGLEGAFEKQLAGTPTTDVDVVDSKGQVVQALGSFPGTPPQPLHTTLDPAVQSAAENALSGVTAPAALVALDSATGEVRAIVSRPLSDDFDRAAAGQYPPGSTFKVITSYALLTNGVTPASTVTCPPEFVIDGRHFTNAEGEASGSIPFSKAFAESCNTAFMGAAQSLPTGALGTAAGTFGFNVDYSLGLTTLGGSIPDPKSKVDFTADSIGQGDVTASPVQMASVAAAVADGTWRQPLLLSDNPPANRVTHPLDAGVRQQLSDLMRLVVTSGTGTKADVPGLGVIGKTGTAEFGTGNPPSTHAWFIGAAKGLGFAVIVEGGGFGGVTAAPLAAKFLTGLPG